MHRMGKCCCCRTRSISFICPIISVHPPLNRPTEGSGVTCRKQVCHLSTCPTTMTRPTCCVTTACSRAFSRCFYQFELFSPLAAAGEPGPPGLSIIAAGEQGAQLGALPSVKYAYRQRQRLKAPHVMEGNKHLTCFSLVYQYYMKNKRKLQGRNNWQAK